MPFYRDVGAEYCQGDLIDDLPSIHLKPDPPLVALRECNLKGNRRGWEPRPSELQGTGNEPDFKNGEVVPAFCQVSRAILLTHGCEIDKDSKHRLVALVRPLTSIPPESRRIIEENRNFSYFHLPPDEARDIEPAYVDFRRITCIAPELVEKGKRLASLGEESARGLMNQLIAYLTRRDPIEPD